VVREANKRGVTNVLPALGDAQALPYGDASFDAAVLITVLGEIPDQDRALSEIERVLKPGGRLIVGEMMVDPHIVTSGKLRERAAVAGLSFERRLGSPLAFFARLEKAPAAAQA
jgi:ubiquinone/menaquinone biosynthesis C-methylase UbiE